MPILNIATRPDILPTWLRAMNMTFAVIKSGAIRSQLPCSTGGHDGKMPSGGARNCCQRRGARRRSACSTEIMDWQRHAMSAYAVDRSDNAEISRASCRWLVRFCKKAALLEAARHRVSNRDSSQVATRAIEAALPVNRSGSHIERLRGTFITAVIWPAPAKSRTRRKRLTSTRFRTSTDSKVWGEASAAREPVD